MSELLEKILDKKNMNEAYKKVCANKGAGGTDGMVLIIKLSAPTFVKLF